MKYKNYGDKNEEYANGQGIELVSFSDPLSARSVNRPMANIYENQEEIYKMLNTVIKTVYGNVENSIIPDIYEEFNPEGFIINSFKNDVNNFFLRIPTGMMLLNKYKNISSDNNFGNPFSKFGEYDYKDLDSKDNYSKDNYSSFIYDNRPNINILERQLANFIALDLTDLTNDIKVECKELPMTYSIEIIDADTKFQRREPDGNLSYVTDNGGNYLYICDEEYADFYIENVKVENKKVEYNFDPQGENNSYFKENNNICIRDVYYIELSGTNKVELLDKKPSGTNYKCVTIDFNKAKKVLDYNGNIKKNIGYYMNVNRATNEDDEVTYLPNKKENAFWKVCLPYGGEIGAEGKLHEYTYYIRLYDGDNKKPTAEWEFLFFDYASEENINNMLFNKLLVEGDQYFTLSKYQFRVNGSEIKHGIKISSKSESVNFNNYKISISYSKDKEKEIICTTLDNSTKWEDNKINRVLPEPAQRQKYYNNIFELTNAFLGRFSSYQVSIGNIYNYLTGETLLHIPPTNKFYIYFDLNNDELNNKDKDSYDKTGKLFVSLEPELSNDNFIKLYDIEIEKCKSIGYAPRIKNIKCYVKQLDRKLIGTKRAEVDSLFSRNRAELNNYIDIKDGDGNRRLEITEDDQIKDNEQVRLTSPISRISTKNEKTFVKPDEWVDSLDGDTPSDFNDSYTERNFITNVSTTYYHNNEDMGIIIDQNKGIKIYNNESDPTVGAINNKISNFKPIEISASSGNINIFNENNEEARIGIRNLQDSEKNIVDVLGITRIRSKNKHQLVIRSINDNEKNSTASSIVFIQGNSKPNSNADAYSFSKENKQEDTIIGSIDFNSGLDDDLSENKTENNRKITFNLSEVNSSTMTSAADIRNAHSKNNKKILTLYGDLFPSGENYSIGMPIGSRTFFDKSAKIPYISEDDKNGAPTLFLNSTDGTSTEHIEKEDRWLSMFVKYGYLGKLTLSDRVGDIRNKDYRNGSLRMGNSNIYDVSSIYINCDKTMPRKNLGSINFDNFYEDNFENSIFSSADTKENSKINFIINRKLEETPETNVEKENNSYGFSPMEISGTGVKVGKDLEVKRQLFVNNHKDSSEDDNNALVVKGQSILKGELILGKNIEGLSTDNYATFNSYEQNKEVGHVNKKYNEEFVEGKNDLSLYTFRNYGRTYLKGDITLEDSKFTEKAIFDKYIKINNNAYGNDSYDKKNSSADSFYYSNNKFTDDYGKENKAISRHHVALDIVNGTTIFGSEKGVSDYDPSDIKLFGSQWIKRRLEIGTESSNLIDTYINKGDLIKDGTINSDTKEVISVKESPIAYIHGASSFGGDTVFGGHLGTSYTDEDSEIGKYEFKYIKNHRTSSELKNKQTENPVKVIFWGNSEVRESKEGEVPNNEGIITDFDFHGCTWFDNIVKIGCSESDLGSEDSFNKYGKLYIKGNKELIMPDTHDEDKWGKENASLRVEGSMSISNSGSNYIGVRDLRIKSKNNISEVDINIGRKTGEFNVKSDKDLYLYSNSNESGSLNSLSFDKDGAILDTKSTSLTISAGDSKIVSTKNTSIKVSKGDNSYLLLDGTSSKLNFSDNMVYMNKDAINIKNGEDSKINVNSKSIEISSDSVTIKKNIELVNSSTKKLTINDNEYKLTNNTNSISINTDSIVLLNTGSKSKINISSNISASVGDVEKINVTKDTVTINGELKFGSTGSKISSTGIITAGSNAYFSGKIGSSKDSSELFATTCNVSTINSTGDITVGDSKSNTKISSIQVTSKKFVAGSSSMENDGTIRGNVYYGVVGSETSYKKVYASEFWVGGWRITLD